MVATRRIPGHNLDAVPAQNAAVDGPRQLPALARGASEFPA